MLQIYHGTGKGKTTAALGLLLRARGAGLPAAVVFFDKGGRHYSEDISLKKLGVKVVRTGLDRIEKQTQQFRFGVLPADQAEAARGLKEAEKLIRSGRYAVIVLDEVLNTIRLKMLTVAAVLQMLKKAAPETELILTGRGLPTALARAADLITEMQEKKHYFKKGIAARQGIEY
jgi:cob(I)alamin adenosyltransferase